MKGIKALILKRLTKYDEEVSKRKEAEENMQYREQMLSNKDNPILILAEKAQKGSIQDLQLLVESLIKWKLPYEMIIIFLMDFKIPFKEHLISTHFIMTSINTVDRHEWKKKDNTFIILGTIGCGKSSLIQFLRDNVKAHKFVSHDIWNLQSKKDINPEISDRLFKAKTVIPSAYEVNLKNKEALIYDTPGFNIFESYEQEIAS